MTKRKVDDLKWFKGVPSSEGIYLRNNPVVSHVVRQDIGSVIDKDDLCTYVDGAVVRLAKWPGACQMWWYGPIPDPPRIEK